MGRGLSWPAGRQHREARQYPRLGVPFALAAHLDVWAVIGTPGRMFVGSWSAEQLRSGVQLVLRF